MAVLTLCRGLPGSGKSTWAKERVAKNGNIRRVNRDSLRLMLHGGKWSPAREKTIVKTEKALVRDFLSQGLDVIVDDTNLPASTQEMWRTIAKEFEANFQVQDFTHVPMAECIKRDLQRPESVGEDVIRRMYDQNLAPAPLKDNGNPKAVIVDIDGTLAEMVDRGPFDWKRVGSDLPKTTVMETVNLLSCRYSILVTSGRDAVCRPETEEWLRLHGLTYEKLFMRKEGDTRGDDVVKSEILDEEILPNYMPILVIDDRLKVIDLWRSRGLEAWQVAPGRF